MILPENKSRVESEKGLLYLYTLKHFSLSPLEMYFVFNLLGVCIAKLLLTIIFLFCSKW